MCDLKTNPCLMEGQCCVLVIFFKYLSPAHFLFNTLAKLYITITAVYTASRCFCFIIYLFILSSQSTRRCSQNLNHYHCNIIQPRRILTLRDLLKRLYSKGTLKFWCVSVKSRSGPKPGARGCKHSAFSGQGSWLKSETSRER